MVRVLCTVNPKHKQRQGISTLTLKALRLPCMISESASFHHNASSNEGSKVGFALLLPKQDDQVLSHWLQQQKSWIDWNLLERIQMTV
ncbi:hypothetical protein AMTRI_Chr11g156570 [Amborella trichopoda]